MKKTFLLAAIVLCLSCSTEEKPVTWEGRWKATWETDPAAFAGIVGVTDFTMPGYFIFTDDKVNIQAFGFPGCAFSVDTLDHTLFWKVRNDSLLLINDADTPGMAYQITESNSKRVKLQLLGDIFVNLEKL